MRQLRALIRHSYGGKRREVGEVYASTAQHAIVLVGAGLSTYSTMESGADAPKAYLDRNSVPETLEAEQKPAKRGRGRPRKRRDMKAESDS